MTRSSARLGVGFVGSGFNTRFHIQSWQNVREGDVLGVWSPHRDHAASAAALSRTLGTGEAKAYRSITEMVADPAIQAIWLCAPNHTRIENIEEICDAVRSGKGELIGIACEKPLARTVREARQIEKMVARAGLKTGYLENQLFSPGVVRGRELIWARGARTTGRPYLSRAAEEHSGPHAAWFWQGDKQGGGVLNDMMCHSIEVIRFLLTEPGAARESLTPVSVSGRIASLKWSRPEYARQLRERYGRAVDYRRRPSEDFASVSVTYRTPEGLEVIGEASTSWSFVGAGLRLSGELLGPEYSMSWNTLNSELNCFFSREVMGAAGEDLVEKQNAEMGLMPVVPDEASAYGYAAENRHFCRVFLGHEEPLLTFHDGVEVVRMLMAAYMSAEQGKTLTLPPRGLDSFVPAVARGTWDG